MDLVISFKILLLQIFGCSKIVPLKNYRYKQKRIRIIVQNYGNSFEVINLPKSEHNKQIEDKRKIFLGSISISSCNLHNDGGGERLRLFRFLSHLVNPHIYKRREERERVCLKGTRGCLMRFPFGCSLLLPMLSGCGVCLMSRRGTVS